MNRASTGKIWGLRHEQGKVTWQKDLASTRLQMVGFGLDHKGEVYIVDHAGPIHVLEPNPPPNAGDDAVNDLHQVRVVLKAQTGGLEFAGAFYIDLVVAVDQNIGNCRIF